MYPPVQQNEPVCLYTEREGECLQFSPSKCKRTVLRTPKIPYITPFAVICSIRYIIHYTTRPTLRIVKNIPLMLFLSLFLYIYKRNRRTLHALHYVSLKIYLLCFSYHYFYTYIRSQLKLYFPKVQYSAEQYNAVQLSTLQFSSVQFTYTTVQYSQEEYGTVQFGKVCTVQ